MDLIGLIPSFGGLLYTIAAFIVALSVIVFVHEYGHYIVGRWSGIKAEVFSIGFGPVLWSRKDRRGTTWQVAALPLGGYVKFLGDASAASDKADEAVMRRLGAEERRHTMHGAPLWARAATVAAGPVFNFILSILVFSAILLAQGTARDPLTVAEVAVVPSETEGLRPGDVILAVEGQEAPGVEGFGDFIDALPPERVFDWTVLRDGAEVTVTAPHPYPPLVAGVSPQSAALDAGLRQGDVIVAVDGAPVWTFDMLREKVDGSGGGELALSVWREGETIEVALTPRRMDLPLQEGGFETRWLIGVNGGLFFTPETETPGILEALGHGADQVMFVIRSSLSGLYHMAVGAISTCNLQGPIGIAETSGAAASQGWVSFIWFIAVLSTAVGLLNLFPIPILDGGHLVFHAWEALTGRPPSDGVLRVMMGIGLGLMGLLMVFALSNDLFCP
jgi:regulator of sigma E protease